MALIVRLTTFRSHHPACRGPRWYALASPRLHPERPGMLGEHVGSNQGIGGHVRHDRVRELPTLTERQRIADPGEGPCQPPAVQHAKEDGRHEACPPRELAWTDGGKILGDQFMDHIAAKGEFFGNGDNQH